MSAEHETNRHSGRPHVHFTQSGGLEALSELVAVCGAWRKPQPAGGSALTSLHRCRPASPCLEMQLNMAWSCRAALALGAGVYQYT